MTRDEAVALIQQQLGFRTTLSNTIVTNMKLAQQTLELSPLKPWFLRSEYSHIYTEPDEERIPLPNDFLEETEESALWLVDDPDDLTDGLTPLYKDDVDQLRVRLTGTGTPEAYALDGDYFRIFPTPDDAYYIRMIYYKRATVLDSNVENGWLKWAPKLLMGATGLLVATATRDATAAQVFTSWQVEGSSLLNNQTEARAHANRTYQIGGSE